MHPYRYQSKNRSFEIKEETAFKPENVLFKSERPFAESIPGDPKSRRLLTTEIIVVDFGSAVFETDHHSKTVSTRHYRAPEIIFGHKWGTKIDIWSLGCMLFEYYTGDTMFDTHEDLEHLAIMERYIGKFSIYLGNEAEFKELQRVISCRNHRISTSIMKERFL